MSRDRSLDVAITGIAARLPGPRSAQAWWDAILAGEVLTTRLRREQLADAGMPESLVNDPHYVPVRGYLADGLHFDHDLFRISRRDAETMDPQLRIMLETSWCAFEDAGLAPRVTGHSTGVYASSSGSGYLRRAAPHLEVDPATADRFIHGCEPDFVATTIGYHLGLTGPAITVQTACSSSLVALHLAVRGLLDRECDRALVVAAGMSYPQAGHLCLPGGIQSPTGHCRPFDRSADGVVAGSGAVALVLRRLDDVRDGDPPPLAVVLGSAVNNDGASKMGYYAPSANGQARVIRDALLGADVDASTIGYLEAHGTGTILGDPVEWSAASTALRELGAQRHQVAVGALKANIGHLDAASGLAGVVKAVRVLASGAVPPIAGFTALNPLLGDDDSPLFVPERPGPWLGPEPRRAGVSSFGIGGTNAHVILEQASARAATSRSRSNRLILHGISAHDAAALDRTIAALVEWCEETDPNPLDVAATLAVGRAPLEQRRALIGTDLVTALARTDLAARGETRPGCLPSLAFAFTGQGGQHPGMAIPLLETLPEMRTYLEHTLAAFEPSLAAEVRTLLCDTGADADQLASTQFAQPALFAIEVAAARALMALGLHPDALCGHSLGEVVAAHLAGALDLNDAAQVVVTRGFAMEKCEPGSMLALSCDEITARSLIDQWSPDLEVAAVNAPAMTVVSGATESINHLQGSLDSSIVATPLSVNRAFHSRLISPALDSLSEVMRYVDLRPTMVPLVSYEGAVLEPGTRPGPEHFVLQARRSVRFADGLAALVGRDPNTTVLEIGPGRALASMASVAGISGIPLLPRGTDQLGSEVLAALGFLWVRGHAVALDRLCGDGAVARLPTYPFAGPAVIAPEVQSNVRASGREAPQDASVAADEHDSIDVPVEGLHALLGGLWSDVLGCEEPPLDADFFDLGGDSLLITHLALRIDERVGVRPGLRDLLRRPTFGAQVTYLRELLLTGPTDISKPPESEA